MKTVPVHTAAPQPSLTDVVICLNSIFFEESKKGNSYGEMKGTSEKYKPFMCLCQKENKHNRNDQAVYLAFGCRWDAHAILSDK